EERDDEGQPPAPLVESLDAQVRPDTDDRRQRHDDAQGRRRLQPAGVIPTVLVLDVLGDVGDGASILPTQAQTLDQPQSEEDEGRSETDRLVRGYEADESRRQPHAGQRDDEGVLSTNLVAEPAEEERPQRPDQEADREDRHGAEESRHRVALLE